MRLTICLGAALALCACSKQAETSAPAAEAARSKPSAFQLQETTWTFMGKDGQKHWETIDSKGNYVVTSDAGKHIDHGVVARKGEKACFDSAMDQEGPVCWTAKPVEVGQSMESVSDKGERLTVMRVAYSPPM